jgi:phosphoglycolate phosphatase-like HAD superfamily hydrolase
MKLVIFDVDGTLTNTNRVDGICFEQALKKEFGIPGISLKWERYMHTTDRGIATEVLTSYFNREPDNSELERIRASLLQALREAHRTDPRNFKEVPGAARILEHLQRETDWKVAIATGCWADSALFKLRRAGIRIDLPFASCDDAISRDEIVHRAIEKAKFHYDCRNFTSVVFVGDGVWDVTTAKKLGIGFIGVSAAEKRRRLRRAGAKYICRDFHVTPQFLGYLNQFNGYESSN